MRAGATAVPRFHNGQTEEGTEVADGNSFNASKEQLQGLVKESNTAAQNLEAAINVMKTTLSMSHGKGDYAQMYEQVRERLAHDTTTAFNDVETMKGLLSNTVQQYISSDSSGNRVFAGVDGSGPSTTSAAGGGLSSRLNR